MITVAPKGPLEERHFAIMKFTHLDDTARDEANTHRIVACVNACEGINPEAVPDMLEALEACVFAFNAENTVSDREKVTTLDDARIIIAKARNQE
jgi:hypothetical protein